MAKRRLFGILGAGGCGRGVMPLADCALRTEFGPDEYEVVFVDDNPLAAIINGRRVMSYEAFRETPALEHKIAIAVAEPQIRSRLATRCLQDAIAPFTIM